MTATTTDGRGVQRPARRRLLAAGAVAVAAVAALAAASAVPAGTPGLSSGAPGSAPPGKAACSVTLAKGSLVAPSGTTARTLAGDRLAQPDSADGVTESLVLSVSDASRVDTATVVARHRRGAVWSECSAPTRGTHLQLPDPGLSDVVLVNPDATDAVVNLTLFGADGEVSEQGSRGISVARRSSRVVPMSVLAPVGKPVGIRVEASQGRVVATARTGGALGTDQAGGQDPSRSQVVAGVPAGAASVRVLLTNPTDEHVTATVHVMTARGSFVPTSADGVGVEASSTRALDLTSALRGGAASLRVTTDRGQVLATVLARSKGDAVLVPASPAAAMLAAATPGGTLTVVNPGSEAQQVRISGVADEQVTVQPGATWSGRVPRGEVVVSGQGVVASVVGDGAVRRLLPVVSVPAQGPLVDDPGLR